MRTGAVPTVVDRRERFNGSERRHGWHTLLLLLALALAVFATSCSDSSSPTAPAPQPPPTATVDFVGSAAIADHQDTIRSLILSTVDRAAGALDVDRLRFTVSTDVSRTIPGWGLGGYTLGPNEIEIVVDPSFDGLGAILPSRLPPIVAHEIHHTVRWRSPGPYATLLEALVSEGMADVFAVQLLGADVPPWSDALTPAEIERYLDEAGPELDSLSFDFNRWFFGSRDLPRWTGYSLGYYLVESYLARNPGRSAADLVHEPAESFRPD